MAVVVMAVVMVVAAAVVAMATLCAHATTITLKIVAMALAGATEVSQPRKSISPERTVPGRGSLGATLEATLSLSWRDAKRPTPQERMS